MENNSLAPLFRLRRTIQSTAYAVVDALPNVPIYPGAQGWSFSLPQASEAESDLQFGLKN